MHVWTEAWAVMKHGMRDASCESKLSVIETIPALPHPLAFAAATPALHGAMTFSERRGSLAS